MINADDAVERLSAVEGIMSAAADVREAELTARLQSAEDKGKDAQKEAASHKESAGKLSLDLGAAR